MMAEFLSEEEKALLSGTSSGSKLMALVNHFSGTLPTTWRETQIDNPFTGQLRERLVQSLSDCHAALAAGEYPFQQAQKPLPQE